MLQYQAYPIFAYNNTYKQLITQSQYKSYMVCLLGLKSSLAPLWLWIVDINDLEISFN